MRGAVITLLIVAGALALLPPLFTHGTCTAEFDSASDAMEAARARMVTLADAQQYLASRALPYTVVRPERCESFRPRFVDACPGGPVLLVEIPVKSMVCRYYRAGSTHVQLGFNARLQLTRLQTDMSPYHMLKLPMFDFEIDWAK